MNCFYNFLATRFYPTNLDITGGEGKLRVNWTEVEKVIAINVGLRQVGKQGFEEIRVANVTGMGEFYRFLYDDPETGIKLLVVRVRYTDLRSHEPINQVLIDFEDERINIASCDSPFESNFTCFDKNYHALFYITEDYDNCDKPDAPLTASVIRIPDPNGNGLIAEYTCKQGYRLKNDINIMPTCIKHGDWSDYDFEPCEAITCDATDFLKIISKFDPAKSIDQILPGTKAILKCSSSRESEETY